MLGFGTGFFEFAVTDRFEASGLFLAALLLGATGFFFRAQPALFRFTCGALGRSFGLSLSASLGLLVGLFCFDPTLFQAHQFFEREENRAFLLFGHFSSVLNPSRGVGASLYTMRIP